MPRVRAAESSTPRCPLCRDGLDEAPATCPGCQTSYHATCLDELGGCATLGCSHAGLAPRADRPAPRAEATPTDGGVCHECGRRERHGVATERTHRLCGASLHVACVPEHMAHCTGRPGTPEPHHVRRARVQARARALADAAGASAGRTTVLGAPHSRLLVRLAQALRLGFGSCSLLCGALLLAAALGALGEGGPVAGLILTAIPFVAAGLWFFARGGDLS